ncbi:MAG: hypothetical protein ACKESB_02065 [Candidatus Hodgkinia cicadicola]
MKPVWPPLRFEEMSMAFELRMAASANTFKYRKVVCFRASRKRVGLRSAWEGGCVCDGCKSCSFSQLLLKRRYWVAGGEAVRRIGGARVRVEWGDVRRRGVAGVRMKFWFDQSFEQLSSF